MYFGGSPFSGAEFSSFFNPLEIIQLPSSGVRRKFWTDYYTAEWAKKKTVKYSNLDEELKPIHVIVLEDIDPVFASVMRKDATIKADDFIANLLAENLSSESYGKGALSINDAELLEASSNEEHLLLLLTVL